MPPPARQALFVAADPASSQGWDTTSSQGFDVVLHAREHEQPHSVETISLSLQFEAHVWAQDHVVNEQAAEEGCTQAQKCSICGELVRGVACRIPADVYTSSTTLVHFGCAAGEHERVLASRRKLYLKRCRRKLHRERWEIVRAKKKAKHRARAVTSDAPESTHAHRSAHAECGELKRESPCLQGLYKYIWDKGSSCLEALKSWAEKAAAKGAKQSLGCSAPTAVSDNDCSLGGAADRCQRFVVSLMAAVGFGDSMDCAQKPYKKPLVQQGSRGAALARVAAARRGVRLARCVKNIGCSSFFHTTHTTIQHCSEKGSTISTIMFEVGCASCTVKYWWVSTYLLCHSVSICLRSSASGRRRFRLLSLNFDLVRDPTEHFLV